MIPLEKQVVSLHLAKRLKELGVKQESYFIWFASEGDKRVEIYEIMQTNELFHHHSMVVCPIASAFTVAELGEISVREFIQNNEGMRCDLNILD